MIRFPTLVMFAAGLMLAGSALADGPPPYPDFTFKMAKPPEPGAGKRITVQIEPGDQPLPRPRENENEAAEGERTATAAPASSYGWFWSEVETSADTNAAARLSRAFDRLDKGPDGARVGAPRLQLIQSIASRDGPDILRATIGTRVSPALALAVIAVESAGRTGATSEKGAQGLMQLMPDTAARFGVTDSLSGAENIRGGVAYLDWLLGEFGGDAVLALAGYNAGEGAVRAHGGVPPFAETRDYIPKVLAAFRVASSLCQTPPQLVTDACALRLAAN